MFVVDFITKGPAPLLRPILRIVDGAQHAVLICFAAACIWELQAGVFQHQVTNEREKPLLLHPGSLDQLESLIRFLLKPAKGGVGVLGVEPLLEVVHLHNRAHHVAEADWDLAVALYKLEEGVIFTSLASPDLHPQLLHLCLPDLPEAGPGFRLVLQDGIPLLLLDGPAGKEGVQVSKGLNLEKLGQPLGSSLAVYVGDLGFRSFLSFSLAIFFFFFF